MSSIHLLVLVHGMWGNPNHLAELNRIARETYPIGSSDDVELRTLVAKTNSEESTYDGIDWGGERVAQEVLDEVEKLESSTGKKVTKFSATGYSLGGLVARYVIGILHQRGFFKTVSPVNFGTIATPNIGLPRYPSLFSAIFSSLGPKLLSRTGEQFYCVDQWSTTDRPLLEVLADPELIFYQALSSFENIMVYANAINDTTVPYVTAAIQIDDPFANHTTSGIEVELKEDYKYMIKSYSVPATPPAPTPRPSMLSPGWFRSFKPSRPILPPFLQFRFPFNVLMHLMLPVLIPLFISLALVRLSLASRSSRARIKALESDASNSEKLIHILARLERDVEDAVVDMVDEPNPMAEDLNRDNQLSKPGQTKPPREQPILTETQRKMAAWLNKLPLKKELAYIDSIRNSHATIVCRDVKRFEVHRIGEGVLRHWASSLII